MHEQVAGSLLRIGDLEAHAVATHDAGVADLAAGLTVERRLVEDDSADLALAERSDLLALLDQSGDDAFGALGLVAEEFGRADLFAQREPHGFRGRFAGAGPGSARLLTLALHGGVEALEIDADAARPQRILRQIEGKAIGVVKRERGLALELIAGFEPAAFLVEDREPALQRAAETGLLELERLGDQRFRADELRIGLPHLPREHRDE